MKKKGEMLQEDGEKEIYEDFFLGIACFARIEGS